MHKRKQPYIIPIHTMSSTQYNSRNEILATLFFLLIAGITLVVGFINSYKK